MLNFLNSRTLEFENANFFNSCIKKFGEQKYPKTSNLQSPLLSLFFEILDLADYSIVTSAQTSFCEINVLLSRSCNNCDDNNNLFTIMPINCSMDCIWTL